MKTFIRRRKRRRRYFCITELFLNNLSGLVATPNTHSSKLTHPYIVAISHPSLSTQKNQSF